MLIKPKLTHFRVSLTWIQLGTMPHFIKTMVLFIFYEEYNKETVSKHLVCLIAYQISVGSLGASKSKICDVNLSPSLCGSCNQQTHMLNPVPLMCQNARVSTNRRREEMGGSLTTFQSVPHPISCLQWGIGSKQTSVSINLNLIF